MLIDRILYPVTTLGPGNRIVIWTVGCSKRCYNCANRELWEANKEKCISPSELYDMICKSVNLHEVDGITFTGGDPLEQFDDLYELVTLIAPVVSDILVYTGYLVSEVRNLIGENKWHQFTDLISVLIDGPYIDEFNDDRCVLRGSTNQNIIYYDSTIKDKYEKYLLEGRKIQNIYYSDKMISVGIHDRRKEEQS